MVDSYQTDQVIENLNRLNQYIDFVPAPKTIVSREKTCEEKCIELGWASGKCKTSALTSKILNPCSKTEKNIGYTLDCKPEKSDVVGVTKACCCIQALPE